MATREEKKMNTNTNTLTAIIIHGRQRIEASYRDLETTRHVTKNTGSMNKRTNKQKVVQLQTTVPKWLSLSATTVSMTGVFARRPEPSWSTT
mmetsp:Transcript_24536/g.27371  ORF Transcript_24536/g.27371 Transcript_24536/m.27371 type:complete len:92 (-) Transcript_24536:173-448(-)